MANPYIFLFHQGFANSGQLWYSVFNGTLSGWGPDTQVPQAAMSASPSAVAFPDGGTTVFHQGAYENGQLLYIDFTADIPVQNLSMSASPSAVVYNGNLYVFHQGSSQSGQLWYSV